MSLLKRGEGFEKSLAAIAMLSIVALAAILVFLLTQALPIFNEVSLFTFLLGTEWYPTGPNPDFEIGALLAASLAVAATTTLISADGAAHRSLFGVLCKSESPQCCEARH